MKNFYFSLLLLFSFQFYLKAQEHKPFSRMDVFELEWAQNPQISPDGKFIVYERRGMDIMADRRQSRLWIMNADGSGHMKLTQNDVSEFNPKWSPSGNRIAFTSSSKNGSEIYIYWVNENKLARISQLERSPRNFSWSPDGTQLAFVMHVPEKAPSLVSPPKKPKGAKWAAHPRVTTRLKHEADGAGYLEPGFSHIFVIPADGGTPRQLTSGDFNHSSAPQWSKDGSSIIFSSNRYENWEYERLNSEIHAVSVSDGKITTLTDRKGPDYNPVISPNGKQIAYLGFDDKVQTYQVRRLYLMNLDGSGKKEIKTKLDRSISSLNWAVDGKGLYFMFDDKGITKIGYTTISGKTNVVADYIGGTSIGRPYSGGSFSKDKTDKIVFTHANAYHPSKLAVKEKGSKEVNVITSLNKDLLDFRILGKVETVWYKSSKDGLDIQGWVVKPPKFDESKKYPLLVENHGGPIANYGERFSPEMQLYATAGFVVFYPNPRGSTGYGEAFGNLLYNNYPGDDYTDVMDGVDHLLKKEYLTEDSLFVTGGSAGGIMTAWMIGKNTRFRSAAVVKPVMNWISKTLTADNYYGYANYRYPGQPWENMENYMKFSPVSLVGNIQTPTLVMVGSEDLRTPLSEAKQLYHALKLRKIETALVEIPGSYHFIANRPSQLITKIDHIVAWFNKYRK